MYCGINGVTLPNEVKYSETVSGINLCHTLDAHHINLDFVAWIRPNSCRKNSVFLLLGLERRSLTTDKWLFRYHIKKVHTTKMSGSSASSSSRTGSSEPIAEDQKNCIESNRKRKVENVRRFRQKSRERQNEMNEMYTAMGQRIELLEERAKVLTKELNSPSPAKFKEQRKKARKKIDDNVLEKRPKWFGEPF